MKNRQVRLAISSVIPVGVGHVKVGGCNGSVGAVTLGGSPVSLAVIMPTSGTGGLQHIYSTVSLVPPVSTIGVCSGIT